MRMSLGKTVFLSFGPGKHSRDLQFLYEKLEKIRSFRIPQLSNFSAWLIPYYDYVEGGKRFLTFQPFRSGEADLYDGKFQLVSYPLIKTAKKKSYWIKPKTNHYRALLTESFACTVSIWKIY